MRLIGAAACVMLACVAVGCGPSKATVTGTVSFNGQPVERGSISLFPVDGKGSANGGTIEKGRYEIRDVAPGEKIVQLTAPTPVGIRKDDYGNDTQTFEDLMPASWGRASREKITVAIPVTTKDFAIEGPDPRKKK
jgi:hypothetical protein